MYLTYHTCIVYDSYVSSTKKKKQIRTRLCTYISDMSDL